MAGSGGLTLRRYGLAAIIAEMPLTQVIALDPLTPDRELDARGLRCPLPLLKAKQALNTMSSGQVLHVLTTDPASVPDFTAYARQVGHALLSAGPAGEGEFSLLLRKA